MKRLASPVVVVPLFALALAAACSDDDDDVGQQPGNGGAAGTSQAGQGGAGGPAGAGGQAAGGGAGGAGGGGGFQPDDSVYRPEKRPFSDALLQSLTTKPGFVVTAFAQGLGDPRMMAVAADGGVYVTRPAAGDVLLLRDGDSDGKAEAPVTAFGGGGEEFKNVHGLALSADGKSMYLATPTSLYVSGVGGDGVLGAPKALATDLPDGGQHGKRTMRLVPGTGELLFSVGSSCDLCAETNPEHATILLIDPAKGAQTKADRTVFARGLRNTLGFDFYPGSAGEIWGMDHGSDHHGNVLPPEELNRLASGQNYGWPYVYSSGPGERAIDPIMDDPPGMTKEQFAAVTQPASLTYDAHSAPIDFLFYTGAQFPAEYKNDAFVALRGSWNRYPAVGYKVVRVLFDDQTRQPTGFEDFVSGWLIEDGHAHFGRVAGLAQRPDGSLLVSDDTNGVIYRVAYQAAAKAGGGPRATPAPAPAAGALAGAPKLARRPARPRPARPRPARPAAPRGARATGARPPGVTIGAAGGGRSGHPGDDGMWWKQGIKDRLGELAGACYCVAASDGHVADEELTVIAEQIVTFAEREVGVGEVEGLLVAARDAVRTAGVEGYVAGLGRRLDEEARSRLLSAAAATMLADGEVTLDERRVYFQIARALGVPAPEADFLIDTVDASRLEVSRRRSLPGA